MTVPLIDMFSKEKSIYFHESFIERQLEHFKYLREELILPAYTSTPTEGSPVSNRQGPWRSLSGTCFDGIENGTNLQSDIEAGKEVHLEK